MGLVLVPCMCACVHAVCTSSMRALCVLYACSMRALCVMPLACSMRARAMSAFEYVCVCMLCWCVLARCCAGRCCGGHLLCVLDNPRKSAVSCPELPLMM